MTETALPPSCSACGTLNCHTRGSHFPDFCLTETAKGELLDGTLDLYRGDGLDARIARASAEVEGLGYGKLTRVEETVAFARRIGAEKIGIATCVGLARETRVFAKVLTLAGLEPYTALCKVGSTDKTEIGIPDALKVKPGGFEGLCNPILQARLLNRAGTQLNVVVGLCVGHDTLFIRHSEAPVTTLVVKDRVLMHNPVAALVNAEGYCSRLYDRERLAGL